MKIEKLTSKEFQEFSQNNKYLTFHQRESWGKLKINNGWSYEMVGLKDKNKVIAAALLLYKKAPLGVNICYSPRGFLIDFDNKNLIKDFVQQLKIYLKKKNVTFLKVDPYIPHLERDINGNIVEDGENNTKLVEYLKKIGFVHYGYNKTMETELQPRWMFTLDVAGKSEDDLMRQMTKQTRKNVKKTQKIGLDLEKIGVEGLKEYKKITEHTGNRRGFIDRPLSYYQSMFKELGDDLSIILCYLDTKKSIRLLEEETKKINSYSDITEKRKSELDDINNKIKEIKTLEKKYGKKICLAGSMFISCGSELLNLYGGGYDEFMKWNAMYAIQWHAIKYAANNGYQTYNFYGIEGNFEKSNNPMYGVYEFKKGFGGQVVELIGEFDLIINKPLYYLYKFMFKCYKKIKQIKNSLVK